jgi:hypothetical protein
MLRKILVIFLVIMGTLLSASPKSQDSVTELYIATFDRAPDIDGLRYWVKSSTLELEGVAQSFFDQEETKKKYPSSVSDGEFIDKVYSNLFDRKADEDGYNYWLNELTNNSHIHRSVFILAIINGAKGDDNALLSNKTTVGLSFANDGRYDLTEASEIMEDVTSNSDSVDKALSKYSIPKDISDIGTEDEDDEDDEDDDIIDDGSNVTPAPTDIAGLLESTKRARERLANYTPSNVPTYGKEFFVSTTGSDSNSGTIDAL